MFYLRLSIVLILFIAGNSFAQEATEEVPSDIELVAFTMPDTEISGVAPAGWEEIVIGSYINPEDESQSTYLLHLASHDQSTEELLQAILDAFSQESLPENSESYETEGYDWSLYSLEYLPVADGEALAVDIAVAERGATVLIIILQSHPDEQDDLFETVFMPAVENFGQELAVITANIGNQTLVPETLADFGIDTVIPAGWENVNPGSYVRGDLQIDPTTLLIQTSSDLSENEFRDLFLERLNIVDAGDGVAYESEEFEWTVYRIDIEIEDALLTWQIATASDADLAYLVVLFSFTDESDELQEAILMPVLDATRQSE